MPSSDGDDLPDRIKPPWIVFPHIPAAELAVHSRQGAAEPWLDAEFRPFWQSLDETQRSRYFDDWNATPEWRDAIEAVFGEDPGFDVEADARESAEYLKALREEKAAPQSASLLSRLFRKRE
jgi:hypothetical protein